MACRFSADINLLISCFLLCVCWCSSSVNVFCVVSLLSVFHSLMSCLVSLHVFFCFLLLLFLRCRFWISSIVSLTYVALSHIGVVFAVNASSISWMIFCWVSFEAFPKGMLLGVCGGINCGWRGSFSCMPIALWWDPCLKSPIQDSVILLLMFGDISA